MSAAQLEWIASECAKSVSTAFASMTGETLTVSTIPSPSSTEELAETFRWQQVFSVGAESLLWLEAPPSCWKSLAEQILRSAGLDEFDEPSLRSTFVEVVQQAMAGFAQALGQRLKREVACTSGSEPVSLPADEQSRLTLSISTGASSLGSVLICVSGGLLDVLGLEAGKRVPLPGAVETGVVRKREEERTAPSTMDLLMEVELPVGVSFGRSQMRLKDVIKLTTGSIVELNRSIVEPVEVIVNNCVIARGEVVVVEGNYGVRIQHIVSREERLRTLY